MPISPSEAAESLKAVEATTERSTQALCYANSSPFFVLWGAIWVIGYAGTYAFARLLEFPRAINWLWTVLMLIGVLGCVQIGREQWRAQYPGAAAEGRRNGRRWLGSIFVIWIFIIAAALIIGPRYAIIQGAFIPLLMGMFYALFGLWKGPRFVYAGFAVTVLTLGGFFYLPEHFLLWMALVGGGSLILVGLWLKRV